MIHEEDDPTHFEEVTRVGITLIKTCGCGMVHLGIGPVTVKLTPAAFGQVADGVREARQRLEGEESREAAPLVPAGLLSLVKGCVQ